MSAAYVVLVSGDQHGSTEVIGPFVDGTDMDRWVAERELERVERFKRVATLRANKALDYIDALTRTADRSRYHYSDKQAAEIIGKLQQGVDQLESAYASKRDKRLRVEL